MQEEGFVDTALLASVRDVVVEHGAAIADPAEVAEAVEAVEAIPAAGRTGEAWVVQAGQPAAPVQFPTFEVSRLT